jgi:peroxiredoxin
MSILSKKPVTVALALAAGAAFALTSFFPVARADGDKDKPAAPPADGGDKDKKEKERPAAPAFKCKDVDGKERTLEEFKDKWVVLEWTNPNCPFVKKFYEPGFMQNLQKTYTAKGVVWLSICSSAAGKEGYFTAEQWKTMIADKKIASTAVLLDADGVMGKAYGAKTTPHIWVIGPKGTIWYTGAIDDTKDKKADPAKAVNYIVQTLDAGLAGKDPAVTETQSYG